MNKNKNEEIIKKNIKKNIEKILLMNKKKPEINLKEINIIT